MRTKDPAFTDEPIDTMSPHGCLEGMALLFLAGLVALAVGALGAEGIIRVIEAATR